MSEMVYKFVIYDSEPLEAAVFERWGGWWFCDAECERPSGPYETREDAKAAKAEDDKFWAEFAEDGGDA